MRNYLATLINSENLIPEVKSQGGQDVLRAQWRSSAFIAALYGAAAGLNVFAVIFVNARMSDNDVFAFSKVGSCSEDNPFVTCNYNFFNLCVFYFESECVIRL